MSFSSCWFCVCRKAEASHGLPGAGSGISWKWEPGSGVPPHPAGSPPSWTGSVPLSVGEQDPCTGLLFVIAEGFLVFGNKCLEPWPVSLVLRPWAFFDGYCLTPLVRPGLLQAGARLVTCVLHLVFSLIIRTGSYCHRPHLLMLQALVKSSQLASGKGGYGIQIF